MNLRTLLCAATTVVMGASYGLTDVTSNDFKRVEFGDIPANKQIATNVEDVVIKVAKDIDNKADRFIAGNNLSVIEYFFKLTPAATDTSGTASQFPYQFVYANTTNVSETVKLYSEELTSLPSRSTDEDTEVADLTWFGLTLNNDQLCFTYRFQGADRYLPVMIIEQVTGRVLNAEFSGEDSYGYSHPYDWRLTWEALDDMDTAEIVGTVSKTNVVGQVITANYIDALKSSKAALSCQYLDEVNLPDFGKVNYEVISGDATIENNIITAGSEGTVQVRATADNKTSRDTTIGLYQYRSYSQVASYNQDACPGRKRVNDWHYNLLNTYRQNPTTNRTYTTRGGYTQVGYDGDKFDGVYGKHFFPYCHVTCNSSGYVGEWWSNTPISKHVLLTAHHFHPGVGAILYLDHLEQFGSKVKLKVVRYQHLGSWAKSNGYTGADSVSDDMGFIVVSTADYDNGQNLGVPDQYISYVATADYIAGTYGYNYAYQSDVYTNAANRAVSGIGQGLCAVSLCQVNTVKLATVAGPFWYTPINPYGPGTSDYSDTPVGNMYFREDISLLARRCGWHQIVGGDSGNPSFIFDPALTTGRTFDFGNGAEPLLRPIVLACFHKANGYGPSVAVRSKVVKAFVESVGDTLDYVLGDPTTQTAETDALTERAIELTKALKLGPNAD